MSLDHRINLRNRVVRAVREATGMHEHLAVPVADAVLQAVLPEIDLDLRRPLTRQARRARNREIYRQFNGRNHHELCQRYGISLRTLQRIVREHHGHSNQR